METAVGRVVVGIGIAAKLVLLEEHLSKGVDSILGDSARRRLDFSGKLVQSGERSQLIETGLNNPANQEATQVESDGMLIAPGEVAKLSRQVEIVKFYETLRYILVHESRLAGKT